MTLLVVLGAGASYDCFPWLDGDPDRAVLADSRLIPAREARPPLTQDLFAPRRSFARYINEYSNVRPLIVKLRATDGTAALEDELARYGREAEQHPIKHQHLMAMRFYLRDVLTMCTEAMLSEEADSGLTNHVTLVHALHEWAYRHDEHVCCVDFNYDTLFEQACADVWRFDPSRLDNYLRDPRFSIVKPHGSIDWKQPILNAVIPPGYLSEVEARLAIEMGPRIRLGEIVHRWTADPNLKRPYLPAVPALAPPIRDKSDFMWPAQQEAYFKGLKGRVSALLTIGWRAADRHFVELLTETFEGLAIPTLVVTGGPAGDAEAHQVVQQLGLAGPNDGDYITRWTEGFSPLITKGVLTDWLSTSAVSTASSMPQPPEEFFGHPRSFSVD